MKVQIFFIIFLFLCGCQSPKTKLPAAVEKVGIEKFRQISLSTRGSKEVYSYYFNNDSLYSWAFDRDSMKFIFSTTHPGYPKFRETFQDPVVYAEELRNQIKTLNVWRIDQAPWVGNIIRFWISNDEIIQYVNPEFKFDSSSKKNWQIEINSAEKLKDHWYYIQI